LEDGSAGVCELRRWLGGAAAGSAVPWATDSLSYICATGRTARPSFVQHRLQRASSVGSLHLARSHNVLDFDIRNTFHLEQLT